MEQRRKNVVGEEIRKLRDAKGWTQELLAARCAIGGYEISRGTLAKVEARIRGISDIELFVIAKALGTTIPELFPKAFPARLRLGAYSKQD